MSRTQPLLPSLLLITVAGLPAFGDEPPMPVDLAIPALRPGVPLTQCQATPPAVERLRHLAEAARHLEAAGLHQQAKDLRRSIRVEAEIRERQRTIARLRQEIDELERLRSRPEQKAETASEPRTVQIEMTLIELGDEPAANADAAARPGPRSHVVPTVSTCAARGLAPLRDLLVEHAGAKVVAAPTILTRAGRSARLLSGGQFPIPMPGENGQIEIEMKEFGTSAELLPTITDEGDLDLELDLEVSKPDFENAVGGVPGLNTTKVRTRLRFAPEQGGMVAIPANDGPARLLFIQPSLVDSAIEE